MPAHSCSPMTFSWQSRIARWAYILSQISLYLYQFFFLLFLAWLWGSIAFSVYISRLPIPDGAIPTDGHVVFTGEAGRVRAALNFCQVYPCQRLHISGRGAETTWLHSQFPITQDAARSTKENITETGRWIQKHGLHSIRLFTSDYHMPRCLLEARVWNIPIIPHPLHLAVSGPQRFYLIFKEYNKWLLLLISLQLRAFGCL